MRDRAFITKVLPIYSSTVAPTWDISPVGYIWGSAGSSRYGLHIIIWPRGFLLSNIKLSGAPAVTESMTAISQWQPPSRKDRYKAEVYKSPSVSNNRRPKSSLPSLLSPSPFPVEQPLHIRYHMVSHSTLRTTTPYTTLSLPESLGSCVSRLSSPTPRALILLCTMISVVFKKLLNVIR